MTGLLHAKRTILTTLAAGVLVVAALAVTAVMIYIDGDKPSGAHPISDNRAATTLPRCRHCLTCLPARCMVTTI